MLALASAFEFDVKEFTSLLKESMERYSFYIFGWKFSAEWLKPGTALLLSIILILPALYFIIASVFKYNFGFSSLFDPLLIFYSSKEILRWFNIISPVVFLLGLSFSIGINLFVMLTLKIWKENNTIHSDLIFKPMPANLFVSAISFIFLAMMFAYAIGENFTAR